METRELAVVWGNRVTIWELGILSPENVLKVNREIQKQKMEKKESYSSNDNITIINTSEAYATIRSENLKVVKSK